MSVVARFYVSSVTKRAGGHATVELTAAASKENAEWASFTPSGKLEMNLTRKAGPARQFFDQHVGDTMLITIAPAEKDPTEFAELSKIWNDNEAADAAELGIEKPPVR